MPSLLCSVACFDVPATCTADAAAKEFLASLDPTLEAGLAVEVYRLERLAPEASLASEDFVVCRVPEWRFDFAALEDLHVALEDLRAEHEDLKLQHCRAREALVSLDAAVEAADHTAVAAAAAAAATLQGDRGDGQPPVAALVGDRQHEVEQGLRQQLVQSWRKHQETKATVIALRSEFMTLVDMMSDQGAAGNQRHQDVDMPWAIKDFGAEVKSCWESSSPCYDSTDRFRSGPPRHQFAQGGGTPSARRGGGGGSPCVRRAPGGATSGSGGFAGAPSGRMRPRGVHSAGASVRQPRAFP
eukprot:TRINITY_DN28810_c0_g1_i1.p2 TRINITY_DN28810_c0_g1~~TRINITY_DN28810_c0_g1_i1.p2  ORF type:complete len:339 (-),score=74.52 TRINITY_DN28810_c0_g1_i1:365-1264(-)